MSEERDYHIAVTIGANTTYLFCESVANNTRFTPDVLTRYYANDIENITEIKTGDCVRDITLQATANCSSLKKFDIGDSAQEIYVGIDYVLDNVLEEVIVGSGCTKITAGSFCNLPKLKSVTFNGTSVPRWDTTTSTSNEYIMFENCNPDYKIYVPEASLNAYKTAAGWRTIADHIFPIAGGEKCEAYVEQYGSYSVDCSGRVDIEYYWQLEDCSEGFETISVDVPCGNGVYYGTVSTPYGPLEVEVRRGTNCECCPSDCTFTGTTVIWEAGDKKGSFDVPNGVLTREFIEDVDSNITRIFIPDGITGIQTNCFLLKPSVEEIYIYGKPTLYSNSLMSITSLKAVVLYGCSIPTAQMNVFGDNYNYPWSDFKVYVPDVSYTGSSPISNNPLMLNGVARYDKLSNYPNAKCEPPSLDDTDCCNDDTLLIRFSNGTTQTISKKCNISDDCTVAGVGGYGDYVLYYPTYPEDPGSWKSINVSGYFSIDFPVCPPITLKAIFGHLNSNFTSIEKVPVKSSVKNLSSAFYHCKKLVSINTSGWNTSNVENMSGMFYECNSLTTLDVSGFKTENVSNMSSMFEGCESLTTIDVSHWNTSNVEDMSSMFEGCSNLKSLNLSSFETSKVRYMDRMFYGCSSLESLDLSNFKYDSIGPLMLCFVDIFQNCTKLKTLNLSGLDKGIYANYDLYLPELTNIIGPIYNINHNLHLNYSPLTNESAMVIINGLRDKPSNNYNVMFSPTTYDSLSSDQIKIATDKGWTVQRG